MSEQKQEKVSPTRIDTRFRNTLLVVLVALFTFGGPYLAYVLTRFLNLDLTVSVVSGFVLFAVGLVLIGYLIKNKVIS